MFDTFIRGAVRVLLALVITAFLLTLVWAAISLINAVLVSPVAQAVAVVFIILFIAVYSFLGKVKEGGSNEHRCD